MYFRIALDSLSSDPVSTCSLIVLGPSLWKPLGPSGIDYDLRNELEGEHLPRGLVLQLQQVDQAQRVEHKSKLHRLCSKSRWTIAGRSDLMSSKHHFVSLVKLWYFEFAGEEYQRISGLVMGSPLSVVLNRGGRGLEVTFLGH